MEQKKSTKKWGMSLHLDLHGCNARILDDRKAIKEYVQQLCKEIKMERYGPTRVAKFGKGWRYGLSAMQFISTSSITLHSVPPLNANYIDIFSCGKFDPEKAKKYSMEYFQAKTAKATFIKRD